MKKQIRNNLSGRSMIEMLGVLAIIGILSAGGIAGYTTAMKNYRANKAMELFQLTSTEIITAFGENTDFTNLTGNAEKLKLDLASPYGGNVVAKGSVGSFSLYMNNVPEEACIRIAQSPWGDDYVIGENGNTGKYTSDPYSCSGTGEVVFTYQPNGAASSDASACEQCMATCMKPGSILARCQALCECN